MKSEEERRPHPGGFRGKKKQDKGVDSKNMGVGFVKKKKEMATHRTGKRRDPKGKEKFKAKKGGSRKYAK